LLFLRDWAFLGLCVIRTCSLSLMLLRRLLPQTRSMTRMFSGSAEHKIHVLKKATERVEMGTLRHLRIAYNPGTLASQQGDGSSKGV
jgi:hypothetical protein